MSIKLIAGLVAASSVLFAGVASASEIKLESPTNPNSGKNIEVIAEHDRELHDATQLKGIELQRYGQTDQPNCELVGGSWDSSRGNGRCTY